MKVGNKYYEYNVEEIDRIMYMLNEQLMNKK